MSYTLIKIHHLLFWLFGVHLRFMFSSNDFIVVYSFYVGVCSYRLPEQVATDITEYKTKCKAVNISHHLPAKCQTVVSY